MNYKINLLALVALVSISISAWSQQEMRYPNLRTVIMSPGQMCQMYAITMGYPDGIQPAKSDTGACRLDNSLFHFDEDPDTSLIRATLFNEKYQDIAYFRSYAEHTLQNYIPVYQKRSVNQQDIEMARLGRSMSDAVHFAFKNRKGLKITYEVNSRTFVNIEVIN